MIFGGCIASMITRSIKKMGGEFELENGAVRHNDEMMDNEHV